MPRLLLLISLLFAVSTHAAQSIDPGVFKALERAQSAQEKNDYGAAHRALTQAEAKPGSLEEALLWRSRAYLAWAEQNPDRLDDVATVVVHEAIAAAAPC